MHSAAVSRGIHSRRYERLRAALTRARIDAGITQTSLATALRRPQSFVSKYETGERFLDVIEFVDVCRAMGVDPAVVLQQL
jgi:transcriptional regulator with XRE-family HTH domain